MVSQYTCVVGTMRSIGSTDMVAFVLTNCAWPSWIRHCNCMLRSARPASACTVAAGMSITVRFFDRARLAAILSHQTSELRPLLADHDDLARAPTGFADVLFVGLAEFYPLLDLAGQ